MLRRRVAGRSPHFICRERLSLTGARRVTPPMNRIRRHDLDPAVRGGILTSEQADRLTAFFDSGQPTSPEAEHPRFTLGHVLYYLGGMTAIGAMSLFMTVGWNTLGGWGGFITAVCYGMLALALTHWFAERQRLVIPAGIMATLAVVMVPVAIFAAQMALGYWDASKPYRDYHVFIDGRWLTMELGTLAVGAVLLRRYRFPFMVMPIAVTLWYMSMDLAKFLFADRPDFGHIREVTSIWFGLGMLLLAFWVDVRSRRSSDYAFWLYLFGVLTFWGGLSLMESGSEWSRLAFCGVNVVMILVGAVLGRRVFAAFGGLGLAFYLGHLSWDVFRDSLLFPFTLSVIGLGIIWLGVMWQRREAAWSARLRGFLPAEVRELLEARAVH
jgi:hypothetical protein